MIWFNQLICLAALAIVGEGGSGEGTEVLFDVPDTGSCDMLYGENQCVR